MKALDAWKALFDFREHAVDIACGEFVFYRNASAGLTHCASGMRRDRAAR